MKIFSVNKERRLVSILHPDLLGIHFCFVIQTKKVFIFLSVIIKVTLLLLVWNFAWKAYDLIHFLIVQYL